MQVSGTTASLVMLKSAATGGSISSPITLTAQASAAGYRSCAAPCYYALSLSANDTLSAPFYDYLRDALYVGDDSGNLHQFFGVFNGSPAENTTSPWPVHLGANKLSSPVYDSETGFQAGYIFVGDMGGVFYSVGSGYGGTTSGTIYGNTGSLGQAIADAPLVDCPQGVEYVFVTDQRQLQLARLRRGVGVRQHFHRRARRGPTRRPGGCAGRGGRRRILSLRRRFRQCVLSVVAAVLCRYREPLRGRQYRHGGRRDAVPGAHQPKRIDGRLQCGRYRPQQHRISLAVSRYRVLQWRVHSRKGKRLDGHR